MKKVTINTQIEYPLLVYCPLYQTYSSFPTKINYDPPHRSHLHQRKINIKLHNKNCSQCAQDYAANKFNIHDYIPLL